MINTHHSSLVPPPLPPRQHHSQPILIPAPLPSPGNSKYIIRFLVGIVLLHLFLSVGAFIYLYQNDKMKNPNSYQAGGKASYQSMEKQQTKRNTLARMVVKQLRPPAQTGYLQWDINHSMLSDINYYNSSWLTVLQPGNYFVYSKVTFSKGDSRRPLASKVKLRKDAKRVEETVMQAFCYLDVQEKPHRCTASQGEVLMLEAGNQLSVWVQDLSLLNYEDGATTFGMYKL